MTTTENTTAGGASAMTLHEYIAGLRDFADFLEEHPDVLDGPFELNDTMRVLKCCLAPGAFETARQQIGVELPVETDDHYAAVARRFGPIELHAYVSRELVCRPVEIAMTRTEWIYDPRTVAGIEAA